MLWLVISSLVIGVSHVPTGASFAAMTMVCGLVRGALAIEEDVDLQIANNATQLTDLPHQVFASVISTELLETWKPILTCALADSTHWEY